MFIIFIFLKKNKNNCFYKKLNKKIMIITIPAPITEFPAMRSSFDYNN